MKLFCPTCGYANEAGLGTSLTCKSCGASFNAPNAGPPPVAEVITPIAAVAPAAPLAFSPPRSGPLPNHPAAVASLVLGLLCCLPFAGIGSIISGAIALKAIQESPDRYRGKDMAIVGMLLGSVSIAMMVMGFIAQALKHR